MLLSPPTDLAARFEVQRQAFARESYPSWQVRISRLDRLLALSETHTHTQTESTIDDASTIPTNTSST